MLFIVGMAQAQTNHIENTGNVGIGTLTPVEKLEIAAEGQSNAQFTNRWDVYGTVGALRVKKLESRI